MEESIKSMLSSIDMLWTIVGSVIVYAFLYSITGVIWSIKLEGKVKANKEVFNLFKEQIVKQDEKMEENMDKLGALIRRVERTVDIKLGNGTTPKGD